MAKLTDDPRVVVLLEREVKKALTAQKKVLTALVTKVHTTLVDDLKAIGNHGGAKAVKDQTRDLIRNIKAYEGSAE
jgi:hypothetical protein